jgi:farnesyl-diphosphate farnesyltransferase
MGSSGPDGVRAPENERAAHAFARGIISRVSRTFAIGISVLPGDLGKAVLTGYLLCRIADTIEDDGACPAARRQELLAKFVDCLNDPRKATTFAAEAADIQADEAYLELMRGTKLVFDLLESLPPPVIEIVTRWTKEMTLGMSQFVGRYPDGIRIQTMDEYRRYCYYVAGTVGHLLTELWYNSSPTVRKADYERMLVDCEAFGEASADDQHPQRHRLGHRARERRVRARGSVARAGVEPSDDPQRGLGGTKSRGARGAGRVGQRRHS